LRLYKIVADDGTPYFGTPAHIQALPEEYRREVTVQTELLAQGKQAEPVRIPRHELVRAKFMNDEDAKKYLKVPEAVAVKNDDPNAGRVVGYAGHDAKKDEVVAVNPHKYDMCQNCPFRETAMKLINKTLEKL